MADPGIFGSYGVIFLVMGIILGSLFVIGLIGGLVWYRLRYKRLRQFKVFVFFKDGAGNTKLDTNESGGIFIDWKTKNKRFFLRKGKVGLDPNNVPFIETGKQKIVFLVQIGLKNFRFINPRVQSESLHFSVGEEDVNWALNAYERQKKVWWQSLLATMLPYIMLTVVSIIILIIFIYFFQKLDTLQGFAEALKEVASELAKARSPVVPMVPT